MAAGDVSTRVVTKYEADVRPEERSLRKLKKTKDKHHEQTMVQRKLENSGITDAISKYRGLAASIMGGVAALGAMKSSLDTYTKAAQLSVATQGVDMQGLARAFGGIRSEIDQAGFAAASMHAKFKLSNEQMQLAAKFMRVLIAEGNSVPEVFMRVEQALVRAEGRALKPFGDEIRGTAGEMKTLDKIFAHMSRRVEDGARKRIAPAMQAMLETQAKMKDATVETQKAIGQMAIELLPLVRDTAGAVKWGQKWLSTTKQTGQMIKVTLAPMKLLGQAWDGIARNVGRATFEYEKFLLIGPRAVSSARQAQQNSMLKARLARTRKFQALEDKVADARFNTSLAGGSPQRPGAGPSGGGSRRTGRSAIDEELLRLSGQAVLDERLSTAGDTVRGPGDAFGNLVSQDGLTPLFQRQSIFGVGGPGDLSGVQQGGALDALMAGMDPKVLDRFSKTGITAMNGLEKAANSAFKAMISGSMGAGSAFKKMSGAAALGISAEMGVLSLKETALAIGSLALGPIGGVSAAGHFKAAAVAGSAALEAAAIARAMGVGGSAGSQASPASLGAGGVRAGGQGGGTRVFIVGGDGVEDNAHRKAARMRRFLREFSDGDDPFIEDRG